jgi:hydrogenase/urease accessory protein HupE
MIRRLLYGSTAAAFTACLAAAPLAAHAGHGDASPVATGFLHGLLGPDHAFGPEELAVIGAAALVLAGGYHVVTKLRGRDSTPVG